MPWLFEIWAHHRHQLPPEGRTDWRSWVILGGRGAGKTRAGAEWVRAQVEGRSPMSAGRARRVALVGETLDQARDVMVFGESGLLACSPPDRRPQWQAVRRRLVWPNGAEAQVFSASDPESLRGPQFDCAWLDELAKWKKAREAWDMLQFALRLGSHPQQVITTTPRATQFLLEIMKLESCVSTSASTHENRAFLAQSFLDEIDARYAGNWLGRQEIEGEIVQDRPGALWRRAAIEAARTSDPPSFDRIVVAVDPPVTSKKTSDGCGIVAVGVAMTGPPNQWRAFVLEDASVTQSTPVQWAEAAAAAYHRWGADCLLAEVNQGGDLVGTLLGQVAPEIPVKAVRAHRSKAARAEPVAALYEQGRVSHVGAFDALEDEMCAMSVSGFMGAGSPDRLDALVWAVTELMLSRPAVQSAPRVRRL